MLRVSAGADICTAVPLAGSLQVYFKPYAAEEEAADEELEAQDAAVGRPADAEDLRLSFFPDRATEAGQLHAGDRVILRINSEDTWQGEW